MAGCLGPYAYTQQFPVYALASLTGVRSLQRLDPVFVALWMTGQIVKAACDLFACRVCLSSLGASRGPWGVLGAGAAMLALGMGAAVWQPLQALLLHPRLWLARNRPWPGWGRPLPCWWRPGFGAKGAGLMRRALLLGLALWLALGLGGCGGKELHQRFLIRGMGVDWDKGGCTVTRGRQPRQRLGKSCLPARGRPWPRPSRRCPLTGREAFYSHNTLVVFGRSCGEGGLGQALEFLLEEGRVRPTAQAYLGGGTAAEVLSLERGGA